MLTDTALKNLKPKSTPYKVTDRDGMYVTVATTGTITFRYDYRLNGRRETLTIGRYGADGLSLARAREKCLDARRLVAEGRSPAQGQGEGSARDRPARSRYREADLRVRDLTWRKSVEPRG